LTEARKGEKINLERENQPARVRRYRMNGWTNRETWLVNLWIGEGAIGDLHGVQEQARYFAETGESSAPYRMGEWLREQVQEVCDGYPTGDGLAADLLGAALAAVNWDEIARHFTDEAIQNEAEQTANANA
jgi:hypothetical protein